MKTFSVLATLGCIGFVHAAAPSDALQSLSAIVEFKNSVISSVAPELATNPVYSAILPEITSLWASVTEQIASITAVAATNSDASSRLSELLATATPKLEQLTTMDMAIPTGAAASEDVALASSFLAQLSSEGWPTGTATTSTTPTQTPSPSPSPTGNAGSIASVHVGVAGAAVAGFLGLAAFL